MHAFQRMAMLRAHRAASAPAAGIQYVGGVTSTRTGNDGVTTHNVSLTSLTGGIGTQPAAGDIVIVAYTDCTSVDRDMAVSGYTEVADLYQNDVDDCNMGVFYKVMSGSPDTSVNITVFPNLNANHSSVIQVFRGVNTTTPMDVAATTAGAVSSGVPNPPSITPVTAGAVVVGIGAYGAQWALGTALTSALTNFITRRTTSAPSTNRANGIGMGWTGPWSSGAVNPAAFGGGTTDSDASWNAVCMALRPL